MINYVIHSIADAFAADFYVDSIRFEMKVVERDEGSGFKNDHIVNIFQSEKRIKIGRRKYQSNCQPLAFGLEYRDSILTR